MYCKFCNTEVEAIDSTGAFCQECSEYIDIDNISKTKLQTKKYIVKVPFSGQSRGNKIFHVDATSEESAVQKVKDYHGDLVEEDIDRDDRSEDRQDAECYGLVHSEPEIAADWWKDKSNFPCMLIANLDVGAALVWVHYQIDGIAYDARDNGYRLIEHTNWRRATKQEILDNIKGL